MENCEFQGTTLVHWKRWFHTKNRYHGHCKFFSPFPFFHPCVLFLLLSNEHLLFLQNVPKKQRIKRNICSPSWWLRNTPITRERCLKSTESRPWTSRLTTMASSSAKLRGRPATRWEGTKLSIPCIMVITNSKEWRQIWVPSKIIWWQDCHLWIMAFRRESGFIQQRRK